MTGSACRQLHSTRQRMSANLRAGLAPAGLPVATRQGTLDAGISIM